MEELPLRIKILRRLNPVLLRILRSPFHGLLSSQLLVLQYRGRKSGKVYTIPLSYVTLGGHVHCVTRTTAWWKSVVDLPAVTIWLRGKPLTVSAERLASASPDARAAFRMFLTANPGTARSLYDVRIGQDGKPYETDVDREVLDSVIVRLRRNNHGAGA
jgi:hypothetical protein